MDGPKQKEHLALYYLVLECRFPFLTGMKRKTVGMTLSPKAIRRGENPPSVAQYCGTSLAMIQADYCGILGLKFDQTVFEPVLDKALKRLVAGPGF